MAVFSSFVTFKKGNKKSLYMCLLTSFTLFFEILTFFFDKEKITGFGFLYHLYIIIEYLLFSLYNLEACKGLKLNKWIKISIPIYTFISICISYFLYHFKGLPALNFDIEAFLLFLIYSYLLFNIESESLIFKQPDFWISIGVLIFEGGVFVFFGLYPMLLRIDPIQAIIEYQYIIHPLNIVFYTFINIGLICLIRNRKSLTR
jgi:hypothetical protein